MALDTLNRTTNEVYLDDRPVRAPPRIEEEPGGGQQIGIGEAKQSKEGRQV